MNKVEVNKIQKQIKTIMKALSDERDKIRKLADSLSELESACDEAYYSLEGAADSLSTLV